MKLLITFMLFLTSPCIGKTLLPRDYQIGVDASMRGDFSAAKKEWEPLANKGESSSQFQLGWLYEEGYGVTKDYRTAIKWYRLAAEQGYAYAQTDLGQMYQMGKGVQKNYIKAYMWFNIAASFWDPDAKIQRDLVAKKLDSNQLNNAKNLTHSCITKLFKNC